MSGTTCDECGATLPAGPTAACPRCLLALGLAAGAPNEGPRRFGRYEVVELIGRGAMGVVWRVRDPALDRVVALKLIAAGRFADAQAIDRFGKEAWAAARLSHPHAIPVYEVGEHDNQPYFTMELVEGQRLTDLVRDTPLAPERAARYVCQIASAIHAAHALGVVHRDLKPSNVLVDKLDHARVGDFGLARRVDVDGDASLAGGAVGTPSYMPPEQAIGGRSDARSDVYGLGAILYELLTGRPPFLADRVVDTLRQVVEVEPAPPRLLNRKVPRDLETVALKCLCKEPERRYASAAELGDELGRFLAGKPIRSRPMSRVTRLARWAHRNPAPAALGAVVAALLALMAIAAVLARQDTLQANAFAARGVASSLLLRLREWSDRLQAAAADPILVTAARASDRPALERLLAALRAGGDLPSDTVFLLDDSGKGLARSPLNERFLGADFAPRDYYRGALMHPDTDPVHVSAAYESRYDGQLKFALSSAVRDADRRVLGVLVVSSTTDATLGVSNLQADERKVVVLGPLDANRQGGRPWSYPPHARHVVVLHPAYQHGELAMVWNDQRLESRAPPHGGADLAPRAEAWPLGGVYLDPVGRRHGSYAGPWLAGIAPVGHTGFFVLVQSRDWVLLSLLAVLGATALAACVLLARRIFGPKKKAA
jgi:eukaryotic-like serine/threonine-protein kinase